MNIKDLNVLSHGDAKRHPHKWTTLFLDQCVYLKPSFSIHVKAHKYLIGNLKTMR